MHDNFMRKSIELVKKQLSNYKKLAPLPEPNDISKVDRFEVIDEYGRAYHHMKLSTIEFSIQDDGKTLKVFLK